MAESFAQTTNNAVEPVWQRISRVWNQLGLSEEEQVGRRDEVISHLLKLLSELAGEEERQRDQILTIVRENRAKVAELAHELEVDVNVEDADSSLLRIDAELEARRVELEELREQRLFERTELEHKVDVLAKSLVLNSDTFIMNENDVSLNGLEALRHKVDELERELQERKQAIHTTVASIQKLAGELDYQAVSDFEHNVLTRPDELPLSTDNIEVIRDMHRMLQTQRSQLEEMVLLAWTQLTSRWEELEIEPRERQRVLKALKVAGSKGKPAKDAAPQPNGLSLRVMREENVRLEQIQVAKLPIVLCKRAKELKQWQEKTYVSDEEQTLVAQAHGYDHCRTEQDWHLIPEGQRMEMLELLDAELLRLKERFEANHELFKAVDAIEAYRTKMDTVTEEDRLRNRGGLLAKLEKMKKASRAARKKIAQWETDQEDVFILRGEVYLEALEHEDAERGELQKQQATLRKQRTKKETEHEMYYGSTPATPRHTLRNKGTEPGSATKSMRSARKRPFTKPADTQVKTPKRLGDQRRPLGENRQASNDDDDEERDCRKQIFSRESLLGAGGRAHTESTPHMLSLDDGNLSALSPTSFKNALHDNLQSTRLEEY